MLNVCRGVVRLCSVAGLSAFFLGALPASALLFIPDGAVVSTAGGMFDLACTDIRIGSTLAPANSAQFNSPSGSIKNVTSFVQDVSGKTDAGSTVFEINADWVNMGTFNAQTSTVKFSDACGVTTSTLQGNTTFNTLNMSSSAGRVYTFLPNANITVTKSLIIVGNGLPIGLLGASVSQPGTLNLLAGGTQNIDNTYVNNVISTGQHLAPEDSNLRSDGNAPGWYGPKFVDIPVLNPLGLLGLSLALMACAARKLKHENHKNPHSGDFPS